MSNAPAEKAGAFCFGRHPVLHRRHQHRWRTEVGHSVSAKWGVTIRINPVHMRIHNGGYPIVDTKPDGLIFGAIVAGGN